ncbi:MAG: cobalt-precorrin-5B (C(1))-methyltransferase CbiD [Thermoguttaceae bacterium]
MKLRSGITTGACAAAAAKAAATVLAGGAAPAAVDILLPGGETIRVPVASAAIAADGRAVAAVRKDAGDDPDVTDGLDVVARLAWSGGDEVTFAAGDGVGTVTKPGLQVPPGEPAINPVPRRMIAAAVREVTTRGVRVEIAIPGGREIARRTFNPRLGIAGGLSILGTTGIVRPYCTRALHEALRCALDVAAACGVRAPVLVPGNIGAKAARGHFSLAEEQLVEVGNAWGFLLDLLAERARGHSVFDAVLLLGHPGKLAKLALGQWDTHSSRSPTATPLVARLHQEVLGRPAAESPTVEGIFAALEPTEKTLLAQRLAGDVQRAVVRRLSPLPSGEGQGVRASRDRPNEETVSRPNRPHPNPLRAPTEGWSGEGTMSVAVFLVDMAGDCLGTAGDLTPWR